ncbi:OmpA family protein [Flavobacteriaceae bacterium F08102]|nr:OmpA family protein [Flavobacteriaceae bacterium F08102]
MKRLIIACLMLSASVYSQESTPKHLIKFLESNTSHSDYAVSFYGEDHLVFSSPIDDKRKHPKQDLFIAKFDEIGQLSDAKFIGFENRTVTKTGLTLSSDRHTVYFSAKNKRKGKHQLFKATIDKDGLWTAIVRLPFNESNFHFTSPTLSPDNTKLYFASDNRQSYGGTDIFVVDIKSDGSFGTPVNLGNLINTTGNEVTPFVSASNVLYYSSDGFQASQGGFDVYQSQISSDGFTEPINLDAPINGPHNDIAYIINTSNRKGYFSSNRLQGGENMNMYSFIIDHPVVEKCQQVIAGVVKDKNTALPIPGAEMILYDNKNEEVSKQVTDETGNYRFTMDCNKTYTLIATGEFYDKEEHIINTANYRNAPALVANKFLTKTIDFDALYASNGHKKASKLPTTESKEGVVEQQKDVKITSNYTLPRNGMESLENVADLPKVNAIYFDFDKAYIKRTEIPQLDEIVNLMKENPDVSIELSAYTDSRGPKAYNLFLSQRRLKSTMNYLIKKGISKDRLSGKGYGEENILNKCIDGVPCSREEHRKNRRTEFNFIRNNAIVTLEKKRPVVVEKKVKMAPKQRLNPVDISVKDSVKSILKSTQESMPLTTSKRAREVEQTFTVNQIKEVNKIGQINADTGTTVAEIKALLDEGVIVESTTNVGDEIQEPKKKNIQPTAQEKVASEKVLVDRSNLTITKNTQEIEHHDTQKKLIQTETNKETFKQLENLQKTKEKAQKKNKAKVPKILGNSSSRPFDQASVSDDFQPNELLKLTDEQITITNRSAARTASESPSFDVKINTVSVTPMTSKRGKYVSTNKAKKIEALRVNFKLLSNHGYAQGYHDAYIVIKSPNGQVVNQAGTFELVTGDEMGFTEQTTVLVGDKDIKVVMFIDRIVQKFIKGTYQVDIYFNGSLSATSNFVVAS